MQDVFKEYLGIGVIKQVEEIIRDDTEIAKKEELSAIDTFVLIKYDINTWISGLSKKFYIDTSLLTKISMLINPFVSAAKEEIAKELSNIVISKNGNVIKGINTFFMELYKKGIYLEEINLGFDKELELLITDSKDKLDKTNLLCRHYCDK